MAVAVPLAVLLFRVGGLRTLVNMRRDRPPWERVGGRSNDPGRITLIPSLPKLILNP
jgi:hypothetical protein